MAYQSSRTSSDGEAGTTASGEVSHIHQQHSGMQAPSRQYQDVIAVAGDATRGGFGATSQQQQIATYSRPIAIRRASNFKTDDSSDDDEVDIDESSRSRHSSSSPHAAHHQSLPSRLLRAPLLGSIPTNEEYLSRRNMLPPFLRLSDQESDVDDSSAQVVERNVSYGSLRDSQLQGRFLDGPSSFHREKTTGLMLRQQQASSRSSKSLISSSAPVQAGLSIGERIVQNRKLQKTLSSKSSLPISSGDSIQGLMKKELTSSLSAMMEASESSEKNNDYVAVHPNDETIGNADTALLDDHNGSMLSVSLTGLEILRRGRHQQQDQVSKQSIGSSFTTTSYSEFVPLSRAMSDPVPGVDQEPMQNRFSDTNSLYDVVASTPAFRASGFLLPSTQPNASISVVAASTISGMTSMDVDVQPYAAPNAGATGTTGIFHARNVQFSLQTSNPYPSIVVNEDDDDDTDINPDMEGAFDLDME